MKTAVHLLRQHVPLFVSLITFCLLAVAIPEAAGGQTPPPLNTGFSSDFQPPRNGSYDGPGPVQYSNGVIARNAAISSPGTSKPSPGPGQSSMVTANAQFSVDVSSNGGASFTHVSGPCVMTIRVTHAGGGAGGTLYDTEMLQLDIGAGTLPPGVMVRESPTRASTGHSTIQALTDGTYSIDSFFDVFTELTLNGGATWSPGGALHLMLRRLPPQNFFYTDFQPPTGNYNSAPGSVNVSFPGTPVVLRRFDHKGEGGTTHPPSAGQPPAMPSFFDVFVCDLSTDGGQTFTRVSAPAAGSWRIAYTGTGAGNTIHGIELLEFSVEGGSLPAGVMIRESPTLASTGKTNIRAIEGGFMIDSFFDVFTELSLDGGQTWTPADGSQRLELRRSIPENSVATEFFPPRNGELATLRNAMPVLFANGTLMRTVSANDFHHNRLLADAPPPGETIEIPCAVTFETSNDGGQTWQKKGAPTFIVIRVQIDDFSGDRIYQTEMLAFDVSGGNLPAGVMIRESPTRASTGRILVGHGLVGHADYPRLASFFDIFPELSTDGGATWQVADSPVHVEALGLLGSPEYFSSNFLPLAGELTSRAGDPSVKYAGLQPVIIERLARGAINEGLFRVPPPAPGATQTHDITAEMQVDLSIGGGPAAPYTAPAAMSIHFDDPNSDGWYPTEMLELEISGGSLPAGVMIRESPSRPSLGRTTIVPVDGGFRIHSFFDVFTEISLDGGQTWNPANASIHLEDHSLPDPIITSDNLLPPNGNYTTRPGGPGAQANIPPNPGQPQGFSINFTKIEFEYQPQGGERQLPPSGPAGSVETESLVRYEWDFDYNGSALHQSGDARVVVRYTLSDSTADAVDLQVEMLSLETLGGGGGAGGSVLLRESPTRQSLGQTSIRSLPDGTYNIDSFFDVFTELSVDGGQTWWASDAPLSFMLIPPVQKVTLDSETMPRAATVSNAAGARGRSYPSGSGGAGAGKVSMRDFHFTITSPPQPLPPAGGIAIADLDADGRLDLALPDGSHVSGDCAVTFTVRVLPDYDSDGRRFFNTEMLSLDVSGGTLPAGVMIRESPTLRSTGRVIAVALPNSTARIGSFFDVFTELSLDGGATWLPSDGPIRLDPTPALSPTALPTPIFVPTDFFPPPGMFVMGDIHYPDGSMLTNMRIELPNGSRVPLPPPGVPRSVSIDDALWYLRYTDPNGVSTSFALSVSVVISITAGPPETDRFFDIELVSLSLNALPPGMPLFRIRESPTLPSTGVMRLTETEGGFMASSFFDVFTELSLDGGKTWSVAGNASHTELHPQPRLVTVPTNFFPPHDGVLRTGHNGPPLIFPNAHMWVQNVLHSGFEKNAPLVESPGEQVLDLPHTAMFEFSTDDGKTWTKGSAPATMTVRVAAGDVTGDGIFDTEMLALDISGGSLPAGVMVRESPSRASTGRTAMAFVGSANGGVWKTSNFFDVFAELSIDGGQTWEPADTSAYFELDVERKHFFVSNFEPLKGDLRKYDPDTIYFVGDAAIGRFVFQRNETNLEFREPPPAPGQTRQVTLVQDMFCDLSLDGGQTFAPVTAPATVRVSIGDLDGDGVYETEMLQMDISGGGLPAGVMIRESPSRPSLGRTTIEPVGGGFAIHSFFDVFTEISLDGGKSWSPAADSMQLEQESSPEPIVDDTSRYPTAESRYAIYGTQKGARTIHTAGGLHIDDFEITAVSDGMPLPPPGSSAMFNTEFDLAVVYRQDFGPVQPQRHRCAAIIRITPRDQFGNTRTFDTEMLALQITGGPAPIMIRESPTRASLGFIEVADTSTGADQRIGSFFDIFTEISTDGGQTWEPTDAPLRVALLPAIQKIRSASRTMPRTGTLSSSADGRGLDHAGGGGGGAGKVHMNDFHFVMKSSSPALPAPGAVVVADFNGDGRLDLVLPDGSSASGVGAVTGHVFIDPAENADVSTFDTEMLQLDISGGSLPAGVMLRESPTLRSTGRTVAESLPGGTFRIHSFFDVFTEISLDGGATWRLSDGPIRIDMTHLEHLIVTGPGDQAPSAQVRGFTGPGAIPTFNFLAYSSPVPGGVRVAVGDVNGDKTEDIIVAPGSGAAPLVKVFDGATLSEMRSFMAYDPGFTGGVYVAAGDVNGDGFDDIIVAPGSGASPHVKVFDGKTGAEISSFFAYSPAFTGGVRVAKGDVNGDGFADIITGAGPGGSPHVKVFDGKTGAAIRSFFAFSPSFSGGVFVAAGDLDGDGRADIIVGADAGGGPQVRVFDGRTTATLASFFAFDPIFTGGVRVAAGDVNGDGRPDIVCALGSGGPQVTVFDGRTLAPLESFYAYPATFAFGAYVGGDPPALPILPTGDLDGDGLLDSWEITYFGNITAHDADDDSDGDGLSELEELSLGLNPTKPDVANQPTAIIEDGYLTITLNKQLGAAYEVQSAGRLGLGGPDTFSADSTTILINDAATLKVRDNFRTGESPKRFMRLQIMGTP